MKTKRDITKVQALASEFGSGAHIVLPKSWKGKRVVCMLKTDFDNIVGKRKND
jgi:putative transposon-encoded protein